MKTILVIDVPEGYETEDLLIDYCLHTKEKYRSIRKSGNNLLKTLPNAINERGKWISEEYQRGWNAYRENLEK